MKPKTTLLGPAELGLAAVLCCACQGIPTSPSADELNGDSSQPLSEAVTPTEHGTRSARASQPEGAEEGVLVGKTSAPKSGFVVHREPGSRTFSTPSAEAYRSLAPKATDLPPLREERRGRMRLLRLNGRFPTRMTAHTNQDGVATVQCGQEGEVRHDKH